MSVQDAEAGLTQNNKHLLDISFFGGVENDINEGCISIDIKNVVSHGSVLWWFENVIFPEHSWTLIDS